ncbi:ABC transporter permease [Paenibacillus sp. FSL H8-0548]|uniref:carbohydrate ABC transporter permease n=1 Tax=Paenibacillus sp. FSL H8-0548 TaxID=1920422 RepID=UPI00096E4F44|nr:carbohydrate ABC transporter permease [Paenibacillus sp. FSL H8-0548]OMF22941.1 ABC transporter permease [Paenibacillus sp. FSL H8-0548]
MRISKADKIFYTVNYVVLSLIALSCLLPLMHIVALSLSDTHSVASGLVTLWPVGLTLESFDLFLNGTNVIQSLKNSVTITIVGIVLSMVFTITTAYPLTKRYLIGRSYFIFGAVFTMLFTGGMIPTYLVVKELGLINTYGALWLPALISTFNLLIMKSFFENIPSEVEEAARMDGCGEWSMLFRIYLPVSLPVIAALSLFYGVGYWNLFMSVMIYMNETNKYNLTVLVQQMIQSQSLLQEMVATQTEDSIQITPEGIKATGIMVMILPMLIVYPFLQKYFVKGVMLGAVKG